MLDCISECILALVKVCLDGRRVNACYDVEHTLHTNSQKHREDVHQIVASCLAKVMLCRVPKRTHNVCRLHVCAWFGDHSNQFSFYLVDCCGLAHVCTDA